MNKKLLTYRSLRQVLYGHFALARISNSPTVVSNTLAGAALAGATWSDARVGLVAVAMVLFYTAGMYLNDLLDYAIDCHERPERPLPSGAVSRSSALACVFLFFAAGSLLLWTVGPLPSLSSLILLTLIICYDKWHKHNPLSPLLMALCRGMVYVTAFLACSTQSPLPLLIPTGLLALYVMALTYIARIKNKTASSILVALLFLPALYFALRLSLLILPILLCFLAWTIYSVSFLYRPIRQPARVVGQLIAGISLLDALVLTSSANIPGTALAAFGLTLYLQRYIKGT